MDLLNKEQELLGSRYVTRTDILEACDLVARGEVFPLVTELRLSGSGYVVRIGTGLETAELPVSRRHTRELKDRLVRATKQAWSQR